MRRDHKVAAPPAAASPGLGYGSPVLGREEVGLAPGGPTLRNKWLDRSVGLRLGAIAAVGLVLRIWYALAVAGDAPLVGDGLEIFGIADVVADGRGYITPIVAAGQEAAATAHKPPLYPLLVASAFAITGDSYTVQHIVTAVIGTGTVVVLALIAGRLAGARAALLAAAIGAVYPAFLAADASLRSEPLYALLIALTLLAAYRAWERPSAGRLIQLGALIALAALTRSEALALLLLLAAPVVWRSAHGGRAWRLAVVATTCTLVLAPWLIRCWIAFDQPVLISTNSGDLIAGANCGATYSGPLLGGWAFDCALPADDDRANEAQVSDRLRARGLRYARDHVDRLPVVLAARVLRPWGVFRPEEQINLRAEGEGQRRIVDWLGLATFWVLAALAVVGGLVMRRRGVWLYPLLVPFALVLLVSLGAYGILRFRAPADLSVIVLAAVALDALSERVRWG
jgi:4-amino-4-deoxy-L-arabinose transferase-like glycosyltransferase